MVEIQIQPLDLSCPAKRSSSFSDSRRFSNGSDDVFVSSTERSPTGSPQYQENSDSDQPQDLSGPAGPARKRFLSKFFRDPKGKKVPEYHLCYLLFVHPDRTFFLLTFIT